MLRITAISSLSSGFLPEYGNVQTLELREAGFDGGAFGDVYDLVAVNGAPPTSPQIVKVLRDNGLDSARQGFETIRKLQHRILDDNQDRAASGQPLIQTHPALRALPQFSFSGQMGGQTVFGYSADRLDTAGYVPLSTVLDPDVDPEPRLRYVEELSLQDRLLLAEELADGIQALRRLSYIHGAINPPRLFINVGECHVALIDFDSGAATDAPDEVPTVFGRRTDGEWMAPELVDQILAQFGSPTVVRVDRYTEDWALTVGIHYLLFLCGPFFFLQRSSGRSIRDYLTRFQWPAYDPADPLFAPGLERNHATYVTLLAQLPARIFQRMSDAVNGGGAEPARRPVPYQWITDLRHAHAPLEILRFQVEPDAVAEGHPVRLVWEVTGAHRVSIDRGIGEVGETGSREVFPLANGSYTLTAVARGGETYSARALVRVQSTPPKPVAPPPRSSPLRVFISYSRKDRRWIERIRVHLKPLAREYDLDVWDDSRISAGSDWREQIEQAIDTAGAALMLVSADFLASDFVHEVELPKLLVKAEQHGTLILPLIVSACRYSETPWLQKLQAVNDPRRPIDQLPRGEREQKFVELALELERALRQPGTA
ncbi:TIR domain-containing protein [Longimicrobium sp.]|uniref:TIR domain-containing protein n=1 Tax=Longimicrobium sp. TaxID=2029185 RepID=UPI003B3B0ED5